MDLVMHMARCARGSWRVVVLSLAVAGGARCAADPTGSDAQMPDVRSADSGTAEAAGNDAFVFAPTGPAVLSENSPDEDEDPFVLRARDGTLFVAWFSHRNGNRDLYLVYWTGSGFSSPVRVTTHPDADFYPNLYQDESGTFHLTWFRMQTAMPYYSYVFASRSADGLTWDSGNEVRVGPTPAGVDTQDWVPTITGMPGGKLLIYFVSRFRGAPNAMHEIFVAESIDGGGSWSDPVALTTLNAPAEHDHLPFAARVGSGLAIAWVRHDNPSANPWEDTHADLMVSTATDGVQWSTPVNVTDDDAVNAVDVFPCLYADSADRPFVVWVTTRSGGLQVVELPLDNLAQYPAAAKTLPLTGYSPRVVATRTPGVFLGVWVEGETGKQDVHYRFFNK